MDQNIIAKLSKFALISSIIGLCLLGICPAFGVMALVVPYVFSKKGAKLDEKSKTYCRRAQMIGIISLFLFVVDLVLAILFI